MARTHDRHLQISAIPEPARPARTVFLMKWEVIDLTGDNVRATAPDLGIPG